MNLYHYFTHQTPPVFMIHNLEDHGTYGKVIHGRVSAISSYKVGNVLVTLDDAVIMDAWVKAKEFDTPLELDTTKLPDGEHTLIITARDTSYHKNSTTHTLQIIIDNAPLHAAFVQPEYTVFQGRTLQLKVAANKQLATATLIFLGKTYAFTPTGDGSTTSECFIPIDTEQAPTDVMITVDAEDRARNHQKLSAHIIIKPFDFPKQKGFTVSDEKIEQERQAGSSMTLFSNAITKAVETSPRKKLWNGPFIHPIDTQRVTTPFGEQRVNQVSGRYMHAGIDLVNRPKCLVWAAQHGTVIIKDRYFTTGNTVVLDHGLGVFTVYAHLDSFADIEVGQAIKKGAPLGKLGMTGYANGYHLHWEVRLNTVAVDPLEWTTTIY